MKRYTYITITIVALALVVAIATACADLDPKHQYETTLHTLVVKAVYPSKNFEREGVAVTAVDETSGRKYTATTDDKSTASFQLSEGFYNISISDVTAGRIFNGAADKVQVTDNLYFELPLIESRTSSIVIKEIYCGGCTKYPEVGEYQTDKYIMLHNNSDETYFLDGLCFGMLEPYNSTANNVWLSSDGAFPDFVPIGEAIWQFGGDGQSFPLESGEDCVIAINGAIDHTLQFPNSVNLNKEEYFVCYNQVYYPNPMYHPVPGDKIASSHYLNIVPNSKVGPANAYPFSVNSPAAVIFRAEECDIAEFIQQEGIIVNKPGSTTMSVVKIPKSWVIDAVEVFNGTGSGNRKRLDPSLDAGYIFLSTISKGHTLHRLVDEQASAEAGYTIYCDTNNSTADFYERESQSIKEE